MRGLVGGFLVEMPMSVCKAHATSHAYISRTHPENQQELGVKVDVHVQKEGRPVMSKVDVHVQKQGRPVMPKCNSILMQTTQAQGLTLNGVMNEH